MMGAESGDLREMGGANGLTVFTHLFGWVIASAVSLRRPHQPRRKRIWPRDLDGR